ncbi:Cationic amino acid transporter 8, vacuolar [Linum perenne]
MASTIDPQPQPTYWRFTKQDFFPEPSFQSCSTYRAALFQTPRRLKDRILSRSSDENELVTLPRESRNSMRKCLTWWDLMWMSFEARQHAGPAIVLSYAVSGLSALLSVLCYTEFAVEIPVAGGSFSFLRIELGDFVAFLAAGNILLEGIVGAAGLGRSWSSYFASMINSDNPDFLRVRVPGLAEGFNLLDPLAFVVLWIANTIAMSGTSRTSLLNWISSVLSAMLIVFIGAKGVFNAAAVVYWSYTGFDMVATMAEETKKPSRDIPIGLIGSMSMITMMVNYTKIDPNAAYSVAFSQIGMGWAKYLVSICALKGMTTRQGRYTTQIARSHMIPPWFALVHPKTGTPIYATLLVTALSSIVALFSSLDVLSSVFSFSTLLIFMLMAVALLVRRYYLSNVSSNTDLGKFLACLFTIIGSAVGFTVVWSTNNRAAKVWGVPVVPWLPALSIGMNVFLIGSLGYLAFLRFFICSAVMVLYYLFVGVHATHDVANQEQVETKVVDAAAC